MRLVELDTYVARHVEVRDESKSCVYDAVSELHTTCLQFIHRLPDVVAIERDIVSTGRFAVPLTFIRRMASHVCLG